LRLDRQRHVHRHLVAVEVGVVGRADERVELDRLALDQDRLERLDAEAVERRSAVQQDRVLADDLVEDVPDLGTLLLHHLLGALDGGDEAALLELVVDEGLEELERHLLRKPALVEAELRTDDDDGAARVVDAFPEEVLAEAPGLALQHVGERLQRTLVRTRDRAAAAAVVEQRVDRLLQHPLLVPDDDVRRLQLHEALQPVVPVDDPAVEVVQVGRREAAAVERDERAEVGRDDGDDLEDHPLGAIARAPERVHDLQALRLAGRALHLAAELVGDLLDLDLAQHLADRLGAHLGAEAVRAVLLDGLAVLALGQELVPVETAVLRVDDDVALEVKDLLDLLQGEIEHSADARRQALQEPDVRDRRGEVDVAHALTAHLRLDDLDAALLAHDAAVPHALVLAAVALVVLRRTEDLGAEEPVALRLERPVVDRLRLLHLAVRPGPDLVGGRDRDLQSPERDGVLRLLEQTEEIFHHLFTSKRRPG